MKFFFQTQLNIGTFVNIEDEVMDMVENFLNYLRFEKRYSAHTLTAYQADLGQFKNYLHLTFEELPIELATHLHIRSFMAQIMEDGISSRTIQRKLISLRSFYKFLMQENILKRNPALRVVPPKSKSRLPSFIENKDMQKLDIEIDDSSFAACRNNLIVQLLYQTGMRLSEMRNLKTEDINLDKFELKVLGKRNKERIIPITADLKILITNYLIAKKKLVDTDKSYLLVLDNGKAVYDKFIYRIVTSTLGNITTAEKKSPHVLRHTYATHLLNNGADISSIKDLLGHSSLAATQIYTHNNIEQLKEAHKNAHPRG